MSGKVRDLERACVAVAKDVCMLPVYCNAMFKYKTTQRQWSTACRLFRTSVVLEMIVIRNRILKCFL